LKCQVWARVFGVKSNPDVIGALKFEIRISKYETISKSKYPPAMHYQRYKADSR